MGLRMIFDRIAEMAQTKGMSIADVERAAGLGKNTIYNWKKTKPSAEMLGAVADALDVSLDYLMGRGEQEDDDVMEIREKLRRRPELKMLFSASDSASKEQILAVAEMIEKWAKNS